MIRFTTEEFAIGKGHGTGLPSVALSKEAIVNFEKIIIMHILDKSTTNGAVVLGTHDLKAITAVKKSTQEAESPVIQRIMLLG